MRLIVDRNEFLKTLGHVQGIVERRTTIPILSNILLRARQDSDIDATAPGQIEITATDMDLTVYETCAPKDVMEEGEITVSAHMLYDVIRKIPDGAEVELRLERGQVPLHQLFDTDDADTDTDPSIEFDVRGGYNAESSATSVTVDNMSAGDLESLRLLITSGSAKFILACLPIDDFPVLVEGDYNTRFSVSSKSLKTMFDQTSFAISTEDTRYYLNGVFMHTVEDAGPQSTGRCKLRMVATDGHRLSRVETELDPLTPIFKGVIIPRKMVMELRKLLEDKDGLVNISLSHARIRVEFNKWVMVSKLIDGTFPDYERVIPKQFQHQIQVDCQQLTQAVDRVSTVSTDKMRGIKMTLKNGKMILSATSTENDSGREVIQVPFHAAPLEIGFNSKYLLDITQQIRTSIVDVALIDSNSPTVMRDESNNNALYVIMPMRV